MTRRGRKPDHARSRASWLDRVLALKHGVSPNSWLMARAVAKVAQDEAERDAIIRAVWGEPPQPCSGDAHAMSERVCTAPAQQCARCGSVRCDADPRPPPMVGGLHVDAMLREVGEDEGWICCACDAGGAHGTTE